MANDPTLVLWPDLETKVHPDAARAIRLLYNAIDNHSQAFTAIANQAKLVATVVAGAVSAVNVVVPGTYESVPTITPVGGGGSGATFRANLNRQGGIQSVTILSGGAAYATPPYLTVGQ